MIVKHKLNLTGSILYVLAIDNPMFNELPQL